MYIINLFRVIYENIFCPDKTLDIVTGAVFGILLRDITASVYDNNNTGCCLSKIYFDI